MSWIWFILTCWIFIPLIALLLFGEKLPDVIAKIAVTMVLSGLVVPVFVAAFLVGWNGR